MKALAPWLRPALSPCLILLFAGLALLPDAADGAETGETFRRITDINHGIVRHNTTEFSGWPANHGLWSWDGGKELLLGFTTGPFVEQGGHKIGRPQRDMLARSRDGGETWNVLQPDGYVDESASIAPLPEPINFLHPDLVIRVLMESQANNRPASYYYSYDRGQHWKGPFLFGGIDSMPELEGLGLTPRTDYQILGEREALFFLSATPASWEDRVFVVETRDGGKSFSFVSWIVSPHQRYRAVMPQTVALGDDRLLSLIRRRDRPNRDIETWIDAFYSEDGGQNWSWRSRVAYAGFGNSNGSPPAVIRLHDGRLLAAYANRSLKMMLCRLSDDEGLTWGTEMIIRDDFLTEVEGFADFGYPRLAQRPDGKIFAAYYFARDDLYEQHIAWSNFSLDQLEDVEIQRQINPAPMPQAP